jgi:ketosteroid isomerase-like protein
LSAVRYQPAEPTGGRAGEILLSAMSEENLELARRYIELSRRRDWSQLELLSDNVVYRPLAEVTETGEYYGRDGFRHYMEGFLESDWAEDFTFDGTSFREHGDAVIVRIEMRGKGRASGIDFSARIFEVLTFKDGEIVRVEDFLDRDDAVRAAGD